MSRRPDPLAVSPESRRIPRHLLLAQATALIRTRTPTHEIQRLLKRHGARHSQLGPILAEARQKVAAPLRRRALLGGSIALASLALAVACIAVPQVGALLRRTGTGPMISVLAAGTALLVAIVWAVLASRAWREARQIIDADPDRDLSPGRGTRF